MVRIGIVGSRFIANVHAQAIRQTPGAELVAACSPTPEHIWEFHRRWEVPHVFQNYQDLIESGFVDAITVACPNDLHAPVVLAAAKAGVHVLVDKPLAMTLEECDEMIAACQAAGVVLLYGENLCFAPKYARAKALADEGALGDVYYVRQLECHYGPHADWFWDVERSGGGVLMDMGCHSIAYCRWVFGNAPGRERVRRRRELRASRSYARRRPRDRRHPLCADGAPPERRRRYRRELVGARRGAGRPCRDLRLARA